MTRSKLASYLDLANHHANAVPDDIKKLCDDVKKFGFHTAFVNPCYIGLVRECLFDSRSKIGTVIAFPLGQETSEIKNIATLGAVNEGADELDICMNVGLFKAGKFTVVRNEMRKLVDTAKSFKPKTVVKFIIETGYLTGDEIRKASQLVVESGADFVKTCSGLGPRGAKLEDVSLIKGVVGDKVKIKVAGGITTLQQVKDFLDWGADRIGTSHAVEIYNEFLKTSQK
ncbi:MAG: deoxyribose-phosphate aldolase [Candidatus Shapirobacteria bacterium]